MIIPFLLVGGTASASSLVATIVDATPTVVDSAHDAFWVEETATSTGGAYKIHNNTSNLTLLGFGVTNPNTASVAHIDANDSFGFVTFTNSTADFWEAFNLSAGNWGTADLWADYYGTYATAQQLYGDIGTALGGDGYANYYQMLDATGLEPGEDGWDFNFSYAVPASSLFGIAVDGNNSTFAFITGQVVTPTTTVPVPAALPLLVGGMGVLGFVGARRRKA